MCQVLFMSKEINCIDKWFVIKNSACLALIFNLSNLRMTTLHEKNQVKDEKYDKSFTFFFLGWLIQTYGLVIKASSSESSNMGPSWVQ